MSPIHLQVMRRSDEVRVARLEALCLGPCVQCGPCHGLEQSCKHDSVNPNVPQCLLECFYNIYVYNTWILTACSL